MSIINIIISGAIAVTAYANKDELYAFYLAQHAQIEQVAASIDEQMLQAARIAYLADGGVGTPTYEQLVELGYLKQKSAGVGAPLAKSAFDLYSEASPAAGTMQVQQ